MANRTTFSNLSAPPVPGGGPTGFLAEYAERMKQLFDASALPLTAIGGTANAVTATLDPVLDGSGLVDGMKFTLTFALTNSAGMTLRINGGTIVPLLDNTGAALVAGAVTAGMRGLIEFIGGNFRILSEINASASGGSGPYAITITSTQTWVKPAGYAPDTLVRVQGWGGGGGGAPSGNGGGGGGGGGYAEIILRYADVPGSVVCTIGAGGAAGAQGGNTTFGSLLTAFRGGGANVAGTAGAGGGELLPGANSAAVGAGGGSIGGGHAGDLTNSNDARSIWGGGGGGQGGEKGGNAVFGGGGGGDNGTSGTSLGGSSVFGGNGGGGNSSGPGSAGQAPGGGGGGGTSGGAGARGEIRIQILG